MLPTMMSKTRRRLEGPISFLSGGPLACSRACNADRRRPHRLGRAVQCHPRCRGAAAVPDGAPGRRRAHGAPDRASGAAAPGHGVAGAHPLPRRGRGGAGFPAPPWPPTGGAPAVGCRVAPGDRARPARGGRGQRELDDGPVGHLPGGADRASHERRGRPSGPASSGLRLQALRVDPQAQGAGAAGVGGKRLRVEALLAAAASPLPPPLTDLVPDPTLADLVPEDLPRLLRLLPTADLYLQDEVEVALHPTLTRVWCRKGRRGQRLVEAPGPNAQRSGFCLVGSRAGMLGWAP